MTLGECVEQLARLEEAVGALYATFSARFAASATAADFWRRLAHEEDNHAARLRLAASGVAFPADEDAGAGADPFGAGQALRHLERLRSRAAVAPVSLEGALALAYGVEHSLSERHLRIQPEAGPVGRVLEQLQALDAEHLARLRAFAVAHGVFLPAEP